MKMQDPLDQNEEFQDEERRALKQAWDPSKGKALCDCSGCVFMKCALVRIPIIKKKSVPLSFLSVL